MIDTAEMYRNEEDVGKALKSSGVKREDIFISTPRTALYLATELIYSLSYQGHPKLVWIRKCTTSR